MVDEPSVLVSHESDTADRHTWMDTRQALYAQDARQNGNECDQHHDPPNQAPMAARVGRLTKIRRCREPPFARPALLLSTRDAAP
jgi:hypothetical protein